MSLRHGGRRHGQGDRPATPQPSPRPSGLDGADDEVLGKAYDGRLMGRLWTVTRPHRRVVLLSVALFPLVAGLELLQPYLIKVAIDDHILVGDWAGLGVMAAIFLGALIALYGLRAVQTYLMHLTGQRVMHDLRQALFAHVQKMDAGFFDKNPVGRLMTRMLNDVEAINELFASGVVTVIGDVLTLTGVVVIMLGMNWKLALVTFALVPVLVLAAAYFRLRARESYRAVRSRLARVNAFLQESLQGMAVIQLFARERQEARMFTGLSAELRQAQFRSTFFDAWLYAAVEAIGSAAVALLLWYGGGQVVAGLLTFGGLVAFLEYTNRFFLPIRDLGAKYTVMQSAMVSSERIFGLLDTEPTIRSGTAVPARSRGLATTPAIEFSGVWFAYAPREGAVDQRRGPRAEGEPGSDARAPIPQRTETHEWVLRECSFRVARGEQVALVGPTGEGKTTIVRLMTRGYEVTRGQVLVEGIDVREWDLEALRRHIGLVPQDVFLFTGTVEANVKLGVDGALSAGEVRRALVSASAERLIDSLPRGLAEEISERGVNLSQGQRQLLAITRALLYNPPVLALDEATSSIDAESEALIREGLARLSQGRTSLIIAHRLSTIQKADRILVLHKGRVRESGRHAELLAAGGIYSRLYELQFGPGRQ